MNTQSNLGTVELLPTKNISFPIGTIRAVKKYYEKLGFSEVFLKHKCGGRNIDCLLQSYISYKLTENRSIEKASKWINRPEVLKEFRLKSFVPNTLYRAFKIVGNNREEVMADIQDCIFNVYDFEHTDTNFDWTSLILWGDKSKLGKYGYSRDHRPDKKQITIGLAEIANPVHVPIGLTVKAGNESDMSHFKETYDQVAHLLKEGSMVVFDKGADSKDNIGLVLADKMKYLTAKKLNKSDDARIKEFDASKAVLIDADKGVYGLKYVKPSSIDYFYFSESLARDNIGAKKRKALRKLKEAKELQRSIDNNRKLPKKFRINNALIDVEYSYQTKLEELSEDTALKLLEKTSINGREGFFCLKSSENLTLEDALATYRQKDSIEKIFNSLKNEIEIKPLRVWTDSSIFGALVLGFIAQLIISLIRYDHKELRHTSTKFIRNSLMNLTVTVEYLRNSAKGLIYSNFDPINTLIIGQNAGIG
jgi:transposase